MSAPAASPQPGATDPGTITPPPPPPTPQPPGVQQPPAVPRLPTKFPPPFFGDQVLLGDPSVESWVRIWEVW